MMTTGQLIEVQEQLLVEARAEIALWGKCYRESVIEARKWSIERYEDKVKHWHGLERGILATIDYLSDRQADEAEEQRNMFGGVA